jgi:hypothetical protein
VDGGEVRVLARDVLGEEGTYYALNDRVFFLRNYTDRALVTATLDGMGDEVTLAMATRQVCWPPVHAGQKVMYVTKSGDLYTVTTGGQNTLLVQGYPGCHASQDGSATTFEEQGWPHVHVFATKTRTRLPYQNHQGFTRDSRFAYQISGTWPMLALSLFSVEGGDLVPVATDFGGVEPSTSPDTSYVAYLDPAQKLRVADLSTGQKKDIDAKAIASARWSASAFSADGQRLWYLTSPATLHVAGRDGTGKRLLLRSTTDAWWAGDKLVASRFDGGAIHGFQNGVYVLSP